MEVKPGYKQTEVGVMPEDWILQEVGSFATTVASGRSHVNSQYGDYPVYGSTGIIGRSTRGDYSGKAVLIARVGANAGKLSVVDGEYGVTDNTIMVKIASLVHMDYFWRQLEARRLNSMVFGSGQPLITGTQIKGLAIPLPPNKAEQVAIAEALSDADALIESLEQLLVKKRHIKQGAMQELLRPKDGWSEKSLGEYLDYEQPTKYLVSSTEYVENGHIPVLTAGKTFVLGYTNEKYGVFNHRLPVIIFDDFTTASKYVDFPFKAKSSAMKMLVPRHSNVDLRFIYELMQEIKHPLGDHKRHWIGEYQHIEIKVPSENEQNHIATILSDMDVEIVALEARLVKARNIKQGMMQELLTGRIRLV